MLAPFASMAAVMSDGNEGVEEGTLGLKDPAYFTANGYIPISSAADLAKIGTYPGSGAVSGTHPANGKYYLANDIVFGPSDDFNGGYDVTITVTNNYGEVIVSVSAPDMTSSMSYDAWIDGKTAFNSGINYYEAKMYNVLGGSHTFVIAGTRNTSDNVGFAYSTEIYIDTSQSSGNPLTVTFSNNGNFNAIGNDGYGFTGIFDGNGHTISGLNVKVAKSAYKGGGLFAFLSGSAQVLNLGIVNSSFTAVSRDNTFAYAGAIAPNVTGTGSTVTIEECYSDSTVTVASRSLGQKIYAGGVIGQAAAGSVIKGCYNLGTVKALGDTGDDAYLGGVIGYMSSATAENCFSRGAVSGFGNDIFAGGVIGFANSSSVYDCNNGSTVYVSAQTHDPCVGGIIGGISSSTAERCYNTGTVTAMGYSVSPRVGGIIGVMRNLPGTGSLAADCYNAGSVTATGFSSSYAGGIMGSVSSINLPMTIADCYSIGPVTATANGGYGYAGGAVGYSGMYNEALNIVNCYYLTGSLNGSSANDMLCGMGHNVPTVDGGTVRTDGTGSGAKTAAEMAGQTIADAKAGNTIYYTGATGSVRGWDFTGTWTIDQSGVVNGGYPILLSSMPVSFSGPEDRIVSAGATAVFTTSVTADSGLTLIYKWYASTNGGTTWSEIVGASASSYSVTNVTDAQDGTLYKMSATIAGYENSERFSRAAALYTDGSKTLTVTVKNGNTMLSGAEITYRVNGGNAVTGQTGAGGTLGITVPRGSAVAITSVTKQGFVLNGALPGTQTVTTNASLDIAMQPGTNCTLTPGTITGTGTIEYRVGQGSWTALTAPITLPSGTVVNLRAVSPSPWVLSAWTGALSGNAAMGQSLTMTSNMTVGAVFADISGTGGGTGTPGQSTPGTGGDNGIDPMILAVAVIACIAAVGAAVYFFFLKK